MLKYELIEVESYSGSKLHEHPRAFRFRGRRFGIRRILDRWYESSFKRGTPVLDYFKVETDDSKEYLIRYHRLFDRWAILLKDGQEP